MRFLPLLSAFLSLANLDIGGAVSRRAKGVGYTLVAIVLLLTAYVLAVGSLALYLAQLMSAWAALGAVAIGCVVAAGIIYYFGTLSAKAEIERAKEVSGARQRATLGTLTGLAVGGGSTRTLIIAALAGLLAGGLLDSRGGSDKDD
ncbi:MAG: hypothetical protein WEA77_15535 [Hyphomonas sp.]|uniref:hypothetical protein n=1 Tax=Hyphomonas sp. TaxID=87 RepID=UPI0034A06050